MATWLISAMSYAAVVAVALMVVVSAGDRLLDTFAREVVAGESSVHRALTRSSSVDVKRSASMIPTSDEWADKLRDPAFWSKMKAGKATAQSQASRSSLGGPQNSGQQNGAQRTKSKSDGARTEAAANSWSANGPDKKSDKSNNEDGTETFRTVCVRPCDGAFFPISFSTEREHFDADAEKCERTCAGGRLYYHPNPGGELDDLEDVHGVPYKKLATAFLFRTTYDASCKCRAHPWEETARTQHRLYALEDAKAKGDRMAATQLQTLTTQLKQAEATAAAEKKRIEIERAATAKRLADEQKRMATEKAAEKKREVDAKKAAKLAEEKAAKEARAAERQAAKEAKQAAADASRTGKTVIKGNSNTDDGPALSGPALSATPIAPVYGQRQERARVAD